MSTSCIVFTLYHVYDVLCVLYDFIVGLLTTVKLLFYKIQMIYC